MQKCVKLVVRCDHHQLGSVRALIETAAKQYDVEGTLYVQRPAHLQIVVAGEKELVDQFIDQLHHALHDGAMSVSLEIEASLKERDYRGVFRIIE